MEWYRRSRERWRVEQAIARQFLTEVTFGFDQERRAFIKGTFRPVLEHGHELGAYDIRIVYPSGFLEGETPSVYLDSHHDRWNNLLDSHIEDDWRLCLFVPLESEIDFKSHESLKYLLLCLATFLFKEIIYQRDLILQTITGIPAVWPGAARSHGIEGIIEALRENPGRYWDSLCFCGSGRRFERCCWIRIVG
jgi:hypothetical protein